MSFPETSFLCTFSIGGRTFLVKILILSFSDDKVWNFYFILSKKDKSIIIEEKRCLKSCLLYDTIFPYSNFLFVEVSSFCTFRQLKIVQYQQRRKQNEEKPFEENVALKVDCGSSCHADVGDGASPVGVCAR